MTERTPVTPGTARSPISIGRVISASICARVAIPGIDRDDDARIVDVGEEPDGNAGRGYHACEGEQDHREPDRPRMFADDVGHFFAAWMRTFMPSSSAVTPTVATRSPGFNPDVTAIRSPVRGHGNDIAPLGDILDDDENEWLAAIVEQGSIGYGHAAGDIGEEHAAGQALASTDTAFIGYLDIDRRQFGNRVDDAVDRQYGDVEGRFAACPR